MFYILGPCFRSGLGMLNWISLLAALKQFRRVFVKKKSWGEFQSQALSFPPLLPYHKCFQLYLRSFDMLKLKLSLDFSVIPFPREIAALVSFAYKNTLKLGLFPIAQKAYLKVE